MSWEMEELEKDFLEALSKIDFKKYDPYSRTFMTPLFIGMLLTAMKMAEDDVEEELKGAESYYETFLETGDSDFKGMASDELRHAGILIKKHLAKNPDSEKREKLNALEKRRQDMMKMIASKQEA